MLSFQVRIAILVSAGLGPMLLAAGQFARVARTRDEIQVLEEVRARSASSTETYEDGVQSSHGFLQAAARLTEVRALIADPSSGIAEGACRDVVATLLEGQDVYDSLAVLTADGVGRCGAGLGEGVFGHSAAGEAIERDSFVLGWIPSASGRRPGVALPLRDRRGVAVGALYAAWRPEHFRRPASLQRLPGGSFLLLLDREGRVVDKQPDDPATVGGPLAELGPFPALSMEGPRVTDRVVVDGVVYVVASTPVLGVHGGVGWTVVGVPRLAAFAGVENFQKRLAVSASGAVFLMLLTLGVSADRLLVRRMARLVTRADALRAGSGAVGHEREAADEFERVSLALEALHAARDRSVRPLQIAVEAAAEGILLVNSSGRVTFSNAAAPRMLGVRLEQVLGAPLHKIVHGVDADHSEAECPLLHPSRDGREYRDDLHIFSKARGARFPVSVVVRPVEDGRNHAGVVVIFEDHSWRRQVEVQLRQSAKMEALGQLASGVAHDFNNLLGAIVGSAELLAVALADQPRREVQDVLGAAERAAALTQQLLTLSRREETAGPVALNDVVRDMVRLLTRLVGANVRLKVELEPTVALVAAGGSQIEQVLLNLVVNARDAMPQGGMLGLRTARRGPPDEPWAGWVMLEVEDSGMGMPASVVSRIFEPFYTTKAEGTGLGLATVARVVEEVAGRVAVESIEGRGTTFRVFFSVANEVTPVATEA